MFQMLFDTKCSHMVQMILVSACDPSNLSGDPQKEPDSQAGNP